MQGGIAVVGLGYVGLPVAVAFGREFGDTVGFDLRKSRVDELRRGYDRNSDFTNDELKQSRIHYTNSVDDLRKSTVFIVAVPTPIDENRNPDLGALRSASEMVGGVLGKGSIVVFESTVYPGVTEEYCGPIIERASGLRQGVDFHLGYSPERINPGDREHRLETIVKVVSGDDEATLDFLANLYGRIVRAGIHRAPSIKVAEAAKVIENTQRDLNIALMNELAIIFDRLGIRTKDVLEAAGTKWNFLRFAPGLVGGHCIGVDPYYLTTKAEQVGHHPEVILAGRRINDGMGSYVARRLVKLMVNADCQPRGAKVGILGITFKENVPDLRNSRVPDICRELEDFGVEPLVHDPLAMAEEVKEEYGIELKGWEELKDLSGIVLAVPHREYLQDQSAFKQLLRVGGVLFDVKAVIPPNSLGSDIIYASL